MRSMASASRAERFFDGMTTLTFDIQIPKRVLSHQVKFPPSVPKGASSHTKDLLFEGDTEYIGCDPQKQTRITTCFAMNSSPKQTDLGGNYIEHACLSSNQNDRKGRANCEN